MHRMQLMPSQKAPVLAIGLKNNTAMSTYLEPLQSLIMKRYLAIFLLVLLPLQLSWAAMLGHCQHETGMTAHHPVHHTHDHRSADQQDTGENTSQSAAMDHDCATCHLGCAAALVSDLRMTTVAVADDHPLHLQVIASQLSRERPERPQWPVLA
jgi:hypothetical protein